MLFSGSMVMFLRSRKTALFLQLFGAGCLLVVVFTHVLEALHLFPSMPELGTESPGDFAASG
jgi:hypothetical protein